MSKSTVSEKERKTFENSIAKLVLYFINRPPGHYNNQLKGVNTCTHLDAFTIQIEMKISIAEV